MVCISEGRFGVDVPAMSVQSSPPGGEGFGVSQGFQSAREANLALAEVALQSADKLTAKNFRSNEDGKKEARARWNAIRSQWRPQTVCSGEDEYTRWFPGQAFQVQTGLGCLAGEEPSQGQWPLASAGEEGVGVAVGVIQGSARSCAVLR